MLGPDPAILFWTPIGILVMVLAGGFMIYHLSKSNTGTPQ